MMKNIDVVKAFVKGLPASSGNLRSTGNELISYSTVIAQYENGGKDIVMTSKKYSQTTSTHQNMLRILASKLIERETI